MADLTARNALFDRGAALGLRWTAGEAADGAHLIFLPMRDPLVMRASLYPFAGYWVLRWTTPLHEVEMVKVDRLNRQVDQVLLALASALRLVIGPMAETEPQSALGLIGFLGALGIALDDDEVLEAATSARTDALASDRAHGRARK